MTDERLKPVLAVAITNTLLTHIRYHKDIALCTSYTALSHPQHAAASLTTSLQTREHVNSVEPSKRHASRSNFESSSMVAQSTCQQARFFAAKLVPLSLPSALPTTALMTLAWWWLPTFSSETRDSSSSRKQPRFTASTFGSQSFLSLLCTQCHRQPVPANWHPTPCRCHLSRKLGTCVTHTHSQ